MIGLDDPLAIPEDRRLVLDAIVWRQAALRLTERHRTTAGVEAHADILGGLDLAIHVVSVFKNISMVINLADCQVQGSLPEICP